MNRQFLKDSLLWGFILWLIGYALGFLFFALVPANVLGWYIMPIGTLITIFITYKFIKSQDWKYFVKIGIVWTLLAIILDYLFIVLLLNPADGYYKTDVYLYYNLTFILPILTGWFKLWRISKKVN